MRPSHKFGFWSSVQKNGLPGEGRHEGLVPRNDPLHEHEYFCTSSPPPPPPPRKKPRRRCEPEEGYLRCSKRFDHRSHSIIFLLFEFKSVDDVGAGKLREMLTLHTNPHAIHGRFTLKDDCEPSGLERRGRFVNSSLRTADVSPRSSPLKDVSRGWTSFLLAKRPSAAMSEEKPAVHRLRELKEKIIDRAINKHSLWAKYFTSWRHYGWRLDCKLSYSVKRTTQLPMKVRWILMLRKSMSEGRGNFPMLEDWLFL